MDGEVDDPRLEDRVVDNLAKHEITESESLLIGRDFGVGTDIETGRTLRCLLRRQPRTEVQSRAE